jgi:hypothetical protein
MRIAQVDIYPTKEGTKERKKNFFEIDKHKIKKIKEKEERKKIIIIIIMIMIMIIRK